MDPLPSFPLFADPLGQKAFKKSKKTCEVCEEARGYVYAGPQYGEQDEDLTVCPWCIADGSAGEEGITFNDLEGPVFPAGGADMSEEEMDQVEQRTPGFNTWQGNHWITCCGKACVYLGSAEAEDLAGRWAEAVPSMFEGQDFPADEQREVVEAVDPEGSPCAYVFKCQVCSGLRAYWDCD